MAVVLKLGRPRRDNVCGCIVGKNMVILYSAIQLSDLFSNLNVLFYVPSSVAVM